MLLCGLLLAGLLPVAGVHPQPVPAGPGDRQLAQLRMVGPAPVQHRDDARGAVQVGLGDHVPARIHLSRGSRHRQRGDGDRAVLPAGDHRHRLRSQVPQQARDIVAAHDHVRARGHLVLRVIHPYPHGAAAAGSHHDPQVSLLRLADDVYVV